MFKTHQKVELHRQNYGDLTMKNWDDSPGKKPGI
jgi:hypothetical protein